MKFDMKDLVAVIIEGIGAINVEKGVSDPRVVLAKDGREQPQTDMTAVKVANQWLVLKDKAVVGLWFEDEPQSETGDLDPSTFSRPYPN